MCPLGIDEIPFVKLLHGIKDNEQQVVFNREQLRWNLGDFWPIGERLSEPAEPYCAFDVEQIEVAQGSIFTDVTWRDYRLVEQADRLAVFNPVFNDAGKLSRGVKNEIDFATPHGLPVYIFQDSVHDSKGAFDNWLDAQSGGTMGTHPGATRIIRKDSIDDIFDALVS